MFFGNHNCVVFFLITINDIEVTFLQMVSALTL